MKNEKIDNDIITLYIKGDNRALELIYHNYYSKMKVIAKRYLCNLEDAEDLVNNVLIKLLDMPIEKRLKHFSNINSLSAFFYTLIKNRSLDEIKRKKIPSVCIDNIKQIEYIESETERSLDYKTIGLSNTEMEVFELYLESKKVSEISKMLNKNLNTTKNILQNAKRKVINSYGESVN